MLLIILYFQLLILSKHIPYLYCSKLEYCFRDQWPNRLSLFYLILSWNARQLVIVSSN